MRIIISLLLLVLVSCGILFPRKHDPFAKQCYFNPNTVTINYAGKNEGIYKIEIELISSNDKYISTVYKENYSQPLKIINLHNVDTLLLKNSYLMINIWTTSPVIENYYIKINPDHWKKLKRVYSRYSTR